MTVITITTKYGAGWSRLAGAGLALAFAACTTSGDSTTSTTAVTTTALASAMQTATTSAGQLACSPDDAQIAACSGKVANDACTLALLDGSAVDGTCLTTIDGATVACAPNPPAPPADAVTACDGKSAGDACTREDDHRGDTDSGLCAVARDGTTLACARTFTPPQGAIDACASKVSGDACTLTGRSGQSLNGICGNGPHGTSTVLACGPTGHFPDAAAACAGLAAGATCSLSAGHEHSDGTCTADSTGAVLCTVACHTMGGPFDCDGAHHGGPR